MLVARDRHSSFFVRNARLAFGTDEQIAVQGYVLRREPPRIPGGRGIVNVRRWH
jgi:hypothetical protein